MKVSLLMTDGTLKQVHNVRRVSNASTRIPSDYIAVWTVYDHPDRPSVHLPMFKVVCVEVLSEG